MANINGLPVNSAVTHAEFMSRTEDTSTTGIVTFNNTTDSGTISTGSIVVAGGVGIAKTVNVGLELFVTGETTLNDTLNAANIIAADITADQVDTPIGNITTVNATTLGATTINATTVNTDDLNLTNALTAPSLTVTNDATINGNLTVNGTTTTLNTATVDSEDPNITLNKNGNDLSSVGAGFTVDRTGTKGSLQYENALASKFKIGDLASESEVVTVSHTQTLTNKTLTSPVLTTPSTDIISATEQGSTPATPASGARKFYPKADGFYQLDSTGLETKVGSGSGGGGVVNLITNGSADDAIASIFTPYADGTAYPVDGIGGSPTGTTSVTSTNPLAGTKSYLLDFAGFPIGEGFSIDVPLDLSYRGKVLKISFDYIFNQVHSLLNENHIIWTCYDITNSKIVEPSNIKMFSKSTTVSDKFEATVQFDTSCTSFRLMCHMTTTFGSANILKVDNVTVSPSVYVYGTPITDWVSFTATGTWTTNAVYTGRYRRVGDSAQVSVGITFTGAPTGSGQFYINLPSGLTIDTSKRGGQALATISDIFGMGKGYNGATNVTNFTVQYGDTTKVAVGYESTASGQLAAVTQTAPFSWTIGMSLGVEFTVPIVGWSSSVQMSDSFEGRSITAEVYRSSAQGSQAITATTQKIIFGEKTKDSVNSFDTTLSRYTILSAGDYKFTPRLSFNTLGANGQSDLLLYKNGAGYKTITSGFTTAGANHNLTTTFVAENCVAGDYFEIFISSSTTMQMLSAGTILGGSQLSIEKIQGLQAIAANETIQALYNVTNSPVMPHNAATNLVYNSKIYDTHGIYNSSTGVITAPISGYYEITAKTRASIGTGVSFTHQLTVASTGLGGGVSVENAGVSPAGFATFPTTVNPCVLYLLAGQTATPNFYHFNSASATTTIQTSQLSIKKVG